jgi:signal transduction histidine kinase
MKSLRSRLIFASVLWTGGLLMALHVLMMLLIHWMPRFPSRHTTVPFLIAGVVMSAGVAVVWLSMRPFRRLRGVLSAVRDGKVQQVAGAYPTEVQPLVDDLNALLRDREKAVQRAIATAGDLAHGLKTPLALLRREAERAELAGHSEIAGNIGQQVERMARQIDYHLARARAAAAGASGNARCDASPAASALVRTLSKLYADRSLRFIVELPQDLTFRVQREDFDEMLGNLLDNACKWARSEIALRFADGSLLVEDDGPGIPEDLRTAVLARGVRADEKAPGSGLGLAIVRDLAELYEGAIELQKSQTGGVRAVLRLPVVQLS